LEDAATSTTAFARTKAARGRAVEGSRLVEDHWRRWISIATADEAVEDVLSPGTASHRRRHQPENGTLAVLAADIGSAKENVVMEGQAAHGHPAVRSAPEVVDHTITPNSAGSGRVIKPPDYARGAISAQWRGPIEIAPHQYRDAKAEAIGEVVKYSLRPCLAPE
jgi:hypothetical protein